VVATLISLFLLGCRTNVVKAQRGDCIDREVAVVSCSDSRAVGRVSHVLGSIGAYSSRAPTETPRTSTEGGDGAMTGVRVCVVAVDAARPS
jgi:hypothetical protein